MDLVSEFSHPTRWYSKLVAAILGIAFFTLLAAGTISGFVIYRIVAPTTTVEGIDLANFPGHPEDVSYPTSGGTLNGWFFPGLKSAPTIVLCPGYQATRGPLLPLATALQDHQYNVFLFDFGTNGAKAENSTLGFRETQDLRAAIVGLAQRDDVDATKFGVWGTNVGAYAALSLAESDTRVRAVVVESVFDRPQDMARLLVARYGLAQLPLIPGMVERGFGWLNHSYKQAPPLSSGLPQLAGIPKLFLSASDETGLVSPTNRLFAQAPEPKEEDALSRGNYAGMLDDEKRSYENRILAFFLVNLPIRP
jgi:hypothetical protein